MRKNDGPVEVVVGRQERETSRDDVIGPSLHHPLSIGNQGHEPGELWIATVAKPEGAEPKQAPFLESVLAGGLEVSGSQCVPAEPDQHEPRRRAFTSKL
jgi:hypothetical protein